MSNFQLPRVTLFDVNGDPVIGGKIEFFLSGTSTPSTPFADADLTIPLTNPVIADGSGRCVPIYLDPTILYKISVRDANNVLLYTTDPVEPIAFTGQDISARLKQVASNPLDYGAIGDGAANEVQEVQEAIDNATYTVDLLGKVYRCDSTLVVPSNRRIINGTLNFAANVDDIGLDISGAGTTVTSATITVSAPVGSGTITVDTTTGFFAGDYVRASTSAVWFSGVSTEEIMRIKSVSGPNTITFESSLSSTYPATVSTIVKLAMVDKVRLENLDIIGSTAPNKIGVSGGFVKRLYMDNCRVKVFGKHCIALRTAVDFDANNIEVSESTTYAIAVDESSARCSFRAVKASRCSSGAFLCGGNAIVKHITISDLICDGGNVGVIFAAGTLRSIVNSMIFTGDSVSTNGVYDLGSFNKIQNCKIRNTAGDAIFIEHQKAVINTSASGTTDTDASFISGNEIEFCGGSGIRVEPSSLTPQSNQIHIENNRIRGCGVSGIFAGIFSTDIMGVNIVGNNISKVSGTGIFWVTTSGDLDVINITGNNIDNANSRGIYLETSTGIVRDINITGNVLTNIDQSGICMTTLSTGGFISFVISNNNLGNGFVSENGVQLINNIAGTRFSNGVISHNVISSSAPMANGILVDSPGGMDISHNVISQSQVGIGISIAQATDEGLKIFGNTIKTISTRGIHLVTNVTAEDVSIDGNKFKGGSPTEWILVQVNDPGKLIASSINGNSMTGGGKAIQVTSTSVSGNPEINTMNINDNICRSQTNNSINISTDNPSLCSNVSVSRNQIFEPVGGGIDFIAAGTVFRADFIDNIIKDPGTDGISTDNIDHMRIFGNKIFSPGSRGINSFYTVATTFQGIEISGNVILSPSGLGIELNHTGLGIHGVGINGNTVQAVPSGAAAIAVTVGSGAGTFINRVNVQKNNLYTTAYRYGVGTPLSPASAGIIFTATVANSLAGICTGGNQINNFVVGISYSGSANPTITRVTSANDLFIACGSGIINSSTLVVDRCVAQGNSFQEMSAALSHVNFTAANFAGATTTSSASMLDWVDP